MIGLEKLRCSKQLSRREFAKKLGFSENTIYQYEKGKREPNLETLKKMAQFFGCTIDELI